jgi:hypothetical protein
VATPAPVETNKADAFDDPEREDVLNDGKWPSDLSNDRTELAKDLAFNLKPALA